MATVDALLERDAETTRIDELLTRAARGTGGVLVIEGAAGIGKTRLLTAAAEAAQEAGALVLRARAGQLERSFAFGVVRQLFEPVLGRATPQDRARHLEGAADLAAPLFDPARLAESFGEALYPLLHGLFWLSANLSRDRPLVLCVDDAQWADDPSLLFLDFLARRLADLPVALVVGTRPLHAGSSRALTELAGEPSSDRLRPSELSDAATGALLRDRLGVAGDRAFTDACRAVTGGNPFLLGELVRLLETEGTAPTAAMAARVSGLGTEAVRDGVLLRVSRLPAAAQALVSAMAVLGDGAEPADAAQHAGLAAAEAEAAVRQLRDAGVLAPGSVPAFAHPVLRTVVHDSIDPAVREAQHVAAAQALVTAGRPAEQAAAHLLAVPHRLGDWAVAPLQDAAAQALALGDLPTAQELLTRALVEDLAPEVEAAVLTTLGRAQVLSMDAAAAGTLSAVLARDADPELAVRAASDMGVMLLFSGQIDPFVTVLSETEAAVAPRDPAAAALLGAGLLASTTISFSAGHRLAARVAALHDTGRAATTVPERIDLIALAYRDVMADRPIDGVRDVLHRAIVTPGLVSDPKDVLIGRMAAAGPMVMAELFAETHELSSQELAAARRYGSAFGAVAALGIRAWCSVRRGDLLGAETDAREALELTAAIGFDSFSVAMARACLITCALETGAPPAALRALVDGPVPAADLAPNGVFLLARAQALAALGEPEAALAALLDVGEGVYAGAGPSFIAWRSAAAAILAGLGRHDEAVAHADEEVRRARSSGAAGVLGAALRGRARLAPDADAHDLLVEATGTLERSGARLAHAHALVDLGALLRRSGSRTASRDHLRSGLDLATAAGATTLADRARGELAASGLRLSRPGLSGVQALTPSERRVAEMAAQGLRNREIAQGLFVTEKTVETHLSRSYDKLDISSRSALAGALAA